MYKHNMRDLSITVKNNNGFFISGVAYDKVIEAYKADKKELEYKAHMAYIQSEELVKEEGEEKILLTIKVV